MSIGARGQLQRTKRCAKVIKEVEEERPDCSQVNGQCRDDEEARGKGCDDKAE